MISFLIFDFLYYNIDIGEFGVTRKGPAGRAVPLHINHHPNITTEQRKNQIEEAKRVKAM